MNCKEIKFNAALLGKEGITVTYRNGEKPRIVEHVYPNDVRLVSISNTLQRYIHHFDGRFYDDGQESYYDLLMFQESRSDEDIIRDIIPGVIHYHIPTLVNLCAAIREDERQKHVQDQPNTNSDEKLPEDIAKEVVDRFVKDKSMSKWIENNSLEQIRFTALVQAGMDAKQPSNHRQSDITVYVKNIAGTSFFEYYNKDKWMEFPKVPSGTYYLTPKKD